MKIARPHQTRALQMLRQSLAPVAKGGRGSKRPLLQLPTGAGKTFIASQAFTLARQKNPQVRLLFIVDALSLVDQTLAAFYTEGLHDIGVIQSDHIMTNWSRTIQIASVQTLRRRGMPRADLVFVDEAHRQDEWLKGIMASGEWADVPFIGLSATPWSKGLGLVYDDLLMPVSMGELIEQGYLCPFRVYAAAHPDLTGIRTEKGDYATGPLSERMQDAALIADIVKTWQRLGQDRPTFVFCVDRAHAKKVQGRFADAGIPCGYIDAYTEAEDRKKIKAQLDAGEIKAVANVACLTTGVDWAIGCIVLARPTKSEMLYVQMVGRGLRVNEGMDDCVILDHADNTLRLGFVTDIHHEQLCTLERKEKKAQDRPVPLPKECTACTFLKPAKVHECPACGFKPEKQSDIEEAEGELVHIARGKSKATKEEKQSWLSQLNSYARSNGKSKGWIAHTYQEKFGVWPRCLDEDALLPTSPEVHGFIRHRNIAYAKRRHAA